MRKKGVVLCFVLFSKRFEEWNLPLYILLAHFTVVGSLATDEKIYVCFSWQDCSVYWPEEWSEHLDTWSLFPAMPLLCWVTLSKHLSASLLPASLPYSFSCLVSWWTLGANTFKRFLSLQHLAQLTPISFGICGCFSHASSSNKNNDVVNQHSSTEADLHTKQRVWSIILFHCVYEKRMK